jgi:hypothetical protein
VEYTKSKINQSRVGLWLTCTIIFFTVRLICCWSYYVIGWCVLHWC